LYPWMFCICGRFVERRFVEEEVLYRRTLCIHGYFVVGRLVEGRFALRTFVLKDVLWKGVFYYHLTLWYIEYCYNLVTKILNIKLAALYRKITSVVVHSMFLHCLSS
jgi:hypothetical protein